MKKLTAILALAISSCSSPNTDDAKGNKVVAKASNDTEAVAQEANSIEEAAEKATALIEAESKAEIDAMQ